MVGAPRYLLDTNICIYIAKRRPLEVLRRFESLNVGDVVMSVITYGELYYGAEKSRQAEESRDRLNRLTELIPASPLPDNVARVYGAIRAALDRAGTPIGANDLWIAAHALAQDLILVSNNTREFSRIDGLSVENWVSADAAS